MTETTRKRARVESSFALARVAPRRLIIGIDVGTRNLGIAVFDPANGSMRLMLVDLLVARDPKTNSYGVLKMEERNMETMVRRVVDELDDDFSNAVFVGIEKQMKRTFIVFASVLQAILNERHGADGLRALTTSPVSVRTHFNIRVLEQNLGVKGGRSSKSKGKKSYNKRKNLSDVVVRKFMSRADYDAAKLQFKKGDGINHVDPFEAGLIALYLHKKHPKVTQLLDRPRKFLRLKTGKASKKTAAPRPVRMADVKINLFSV